MSARKPVLGYPSKSAAVRALREQKVPDAEIARLIGCKKKNVRALVPLKERKRNRCSSGRRRISLPPDLFVIAASAAAARGISEHEVMRRIVENVLDDGLVDAVLDDGVTTPTAVKTLQQAAVMQ